MALPTSKMKPELKDPATKARKGFWWGLLSPSPQVSTIAVTRKPSAPELLRERPECNVSRTQPASLTLAQNPPQNKASLNATVPRCKDRLRELGLTTPVVLTQPRIACSEAVLPRADKVISPQDMVFNGMRSASSKPTRNHVSSPRPRSKSSVENRQSTSDSIVGNEQQVWDITYNDRRFDPLSMSTSNLAIPSHGEASQMAVAGEFEETTTDDVVRDEDPVRRPSVSPSSSTPCSPSTSYNRAPSYNRPKAQQKTHNRQISVTSQHFQAHAPTEPVSLFPVDEGLFGRPKPPPPLKIIPKKTKQHRRKQTAPTPILPRSTSYEHLPTRKPHTRSQSMYHAPVRRGSPSGPVGHLHVSDSLISSDSASPPPLPSGGVRVHVQARNEHSLSRTCTSTTVGSGETGASSGLSRGEKLAWAPPANWSGPLACSIEGGDSAPSTKKSIFPATSPLRRVKSSSKLVASAATKFLYSHPVMPSATPAHSTTIKLGDDEPLHPIQWGRDNHRVVVRMQEFPGDDLKEAPLHDVISRLRELKSSAA